MIPSNVVTSYHQAPCPYCSKNKPVKWFRGKPSGPRESWNRHWWVPLPKPLYVPSLRGRRPDYHGFWCPEKFARTRNGGFKGCLMEMSESEGGSIIRP